MVIQPSKCRPCRQAMFLPGRAGELKNIRSFAARYFKGTALVIAQTNLVSDRIDKLPLWLEGH